MNRRDAETQRFGERSIKIYRLFTSTPFLLFSLCLCVSAVNISCTTKPSDLRTLVPAETLVYLETNDLAAALQPIVDSKPFSSIVTKKPDFSALKVVQVAVAVTGFETSEVAVTDEQAVGKVQPRFVAVADTHAWNYQAVAFAEKKLGGFVTEIYDAEPKLEKSDKHGGKYFTWTSPNVGDGRKAFALVIDSLIYFGNDESAIDKALSVRSGQTDSIAKTGKLPPYVPGNLASGYVSTDGVAQIAALAGLHFASQASDEEEVQSAVAGILPRLIRGTVTDVSWSTSQTSEGIEDKWSVTMPAEIANVFSETLAATGYADKRSLASIPTNATTSTSYNFEDAQIAWRSLLLVAQKQTDPLSAKAIEEFARLLFEPYGIANPEAFLSVTSSSFVTANFSPDGDKPVLRTVLTDMRKVEDSLVSDLKRPVGSPEFHRLRTSSDSDLAMFYIDATYVGGDSEIVERIHKGTDSFESGAATRTYQSIDPKSLTVTVGRESNLTLPLVTFLANEGHGDTQVVSTYLTETRFTKTGMERRTVSDLGFIGWMIAQLAAE